MDIFEQQPDPAARTATEHNRARGALLVVSTPTRSTGPTGPGGHPVLGQLGARAPRYVQRVRRRHRVEITRHTATALLIAGVMVSGPALAWSSGPDAAASPARAQHRAAPHRVAASRSSARSSTPRSVPAIAVSEAFVATPSPTTPIAVGATETSSFRGAYASRHGRRVWVAYPAARSHPFLVCTRSFESDTAGGYQAVSPDGRHRGAYQFKRSTWNTVADRVGRTDLVGIDPARAAAHDQDWMALFLYKWLGASHWEGRCSGK